jgi:hypothetical protein
VPQPKGLGVLAPCINPPHAQKTLQSGLKSPDGLLGLLAPHLRYSRLRRPAAFAPATSSKICVDSQREMARRPLDKRDAEDLFESDELAVHGGQEKTQLTAYG